ncbi:MAG: hypothetical protein WKG52_00265 [Variovorax sp.]
MSDPVGYICESCNFPGPREEFEANDELAPDLVDAGQCPECGEMVEDLDDWAFD